MGTSRIEQSMDPAVLKGTRYAPAYNAAIPAATLTENLQHIELFARLDKNLKYIFLETFFYNFLRDQALPSRETIGGVVRSYVALNFSLPAVTASIDTLIANHTGAYGQHIDSSGYFVHDPWYDSKYAFAQPLYIKAIARIEKIGMSKTVRPSALRIIDDIEELCEKRGIKLYLITAPNYAWDDYRIMKTGLWPALTDQLRYLSQYQHVLSFAQHNYVTEETPGSKMKWWYDPIHFTIDTGTLMLQSIVQRHAVGPSNFMETITPETVGPLLRIRKDAVIKWAASNSNPQFVEPFDRAVRQFTESKR